ncbi:peptidoglycan editing factor PgeF [Loktanella sp. DJP18]|uniref:peptidoglycan editing factor PgeF n=1 Tax=Loktanella sp. DJP18 TaxID=3409788 RepID=UPI003BB5A5FD
MTLDIITAPSLAPLRHGFFSRMGGASSGVFAGLNCGFGSSDQSDIVQINRNRVAAAMGVVPVALVGVHQVHSATVVTVDGSPRDASQADGLVTATPGVALSVLTADCQPILFADSDTGVIGACHAGWKGALHGIIENTVTAMERLGARRASIAAVIGPTISQRAYEVGPEFRDAVLEADEQAARYFVQGTGDRLQFDLPAYGLSRLRRAGVGQAEWTRHCTYADPARFFSYRRSVHAKDPDYGRLIAAITL